MSSPRTLENMAPVTIFTGFLSAGKAMLQKCILTKFHGCQVTVIENEFDKGYIDSELPAQDQDKQAIKLSNGCVCHTAHGVQAFDSQDAAQQQVGFADYILISKHSLIANAQYDVLRSRLSRINPRVPITLVNFGKVDMTSMIDISSFNLNSVLELIRSFFTQRGRTI